MENSRNGNNIDNTFLSSQYSLIYDADTGRSNYSLNNTRYHVYEAKGVFSTLGYYLHQCFSCFSLWTTHQINLNGKTHTFLIKKSDETAINDQENRITMISSSVIPKREKPIMKPKSTDSTLPPLITQGIVREGTGEGEFPHFKTICDVIDTKTLWSAAFTCCFHSIESTQEIYELIGSIRKEMEPKKIDLFAEEFHTDTYLESRMRLYNNLAELHKALPGEDKSKKAKIYWSERARQVLIPHLLKNEHVNIEDLVFTIVAGNKKNSLFQAEEWDQTQQLQFVGIGKEKIFGELNKEILDKSTDSEDVEIAYETKSDNALMNCAHKYAYLLASRS